MRRFLLTFLMLFSMTAIYAGEGNAELIFLDKRIFRVSDVKSGDVVEKIVRIKNVGTVDLNILNYKPSCNCTKVELPQTLGPGQTGQIKIITNTVGKQGENTITVLFDANTSQRDYVIRIVLDIAP